jgi:hypothetical protein
MSRGDHLPGAGGLGKAGCADGVGEIVEAVVGFFEDGEGILSVEEFGVGV